MDRIGRFGINESVVLDTVSGSANVRNAMPNHASGFPLSLCINSRYSEGGMHDDVLLRWNHDER